MTDRTVVWLLSAAALIASLGCGQPKAPDQVSTEVDNPALAIRLAQVPDDFRVITNHDETLVLSPSTEGVEGTVTFHVGPEETGINLVAAVHDHQARIEGLEGGTYSGARELEGPLGAAFYSRGSYVVDGARVEETMLTAIHPDGDRRLELVYTYPQGDDSSARVTALIGLLAEVEALPPAQ